MAISSERQLKTDSHCHDGVDRPAVSQGRLKAYEVRRFDRPLVESIAQALDHTQHARLAGLAQQHLEQRVSLDALSARRRGVLGAGLFEDLRRLLDGRRRRRPCGFVGPRLGYSPPESRRLLRLC